MPLKKRKLGNQGLEVSELAIACMRMSHIYPAILIIHRALELGINFFDTSVIGTPHVHEELVGRALKGRRHFAIIATKVCLHILPGHLQGAVEASLQRLDTDYIDLLYLDPVDTSVPIEELIGAMAECVTAGKVRFLGLFEAKEATIRHAHAVHPISAWQGGNSPLNSPILPLLRELNIGIVPLTSFDEKMAASAVVHDIAVRKGLTFCQIALAWLLHRGEDIVPIFGVKRRNHLEKNILAVNITLTDPEVAELDAALPLAHTSEASHTSHLMDVPLKEGTSHKSIALLAAQDLETMTDEELDRNWKLDQFFGEIKVISTDPQGVRCRRCKEELALIGLQEGCYSLFPGVEGYSLTPSLWKRAENWWDDEDSDKQRQGRMGCFMAHFLAIKDSAEKLEIATEYLEELYDDQTASLEAISDAEASVRRYSSVLIIEDNAGFGRVLDATHATREAMGRKLRLALHELPEGWDMFYFVTNADLCGPSTQVSPNLLRLNYGLLMKVYAVNSKMYPLILDQLKALMASNEKIPPVDHAIAMLHPYTRCYASLKEGLAYRFGSVSEIYNLDKKVDIENWQPCTENVVPFCAS